MTCPLLFLTVELPRKEKFLPLCHHINNTKNIQSVRMMNGLECVFERLMFSGERILFEAPLDAHLEICSYSFLFDSTKSSKIDCKLLYIK